LFDPEQQFGTLRLAPIAITQGVKASAEERRRDVYESHRHRIFALAFHMTGNEVEAESILTDTFVSAFRKSDEPSANIVDRALVTHLEDEQILDKTETAPVPVQTKDQMVGNVRRPDLEEAIRHLPSAERLTFLFHDVEGYSPAKIAELMEIPEGKVQRTLMMARIRLRGILAANAADRRAAA
jgi:RNA polymerase sigma factor (sigma-70 family)